MPSRVQAIDRIYGSLHRSATSPQRQERYARINVPSPQRQEPSVRINVPSPQRQEHYVRINVPSLQWQKRYIDIKTVSLRGRMEAPASGGIVPERAQ